MLDLPYASPGHVHGCGWRWSYFPLPSQFGTYGWIYRQSTAISSRANHRKRTTRPEQSTFVHVLGYLFAPLS
ncbi:hypothetical protein Mycsm_01848 [Mycobacterium sp. JS623]|nr:hypothetical protein Mycsm_01848 [Mycobacterium sp. JS623]